MLIDIKTELQKTYQVIKQDEKLRLYEQLFNNIRLDKMNILELGIHTGGSLMMWSQYFKNSTVYGVDISLKLVNIPQSSSIKLFEGSQTDLRLLTELTNNTMFDIVIDDGSHMCDDIIKSFEFLISKTKYYYINEDICVGPEWNSRNNNSCWYGGENGFTIRNYFNSLRENNEIRTKYNIKEVDEVDGKFNLVSKYHG